MLLVIGILVVVALCGLFAWIAPASPSRADRNRRDGEAFGWRDGHNVSWFGRNDRPDGLD